MNKKKFAVIFLLCISVIFMPTFVFAQNEQSEATVFKQYQTFSWKAIPNARKYEVVVEREIEKDSWVAEQNGQTTDHRLEILLVPGTYRVKIDAFNVLGKRASSSDWVSFLILDEKKPYFFDDTFESTSDGLVLRFVEPVVASDESVSLELPEQEANGEQDISQTILKVHGKNFFFEGTQFNFIPQEDVALPLSITGRPSVPLSIVERDRDNDSITLSYDAEKMYSGAYVLEAVNPGENNISSKKFIFEDTRKAVMDIPSLKYNRRYAVRNISVKRDDTVSLDLECYNLDFNAKFSLCAFDGGIPYPFTSIRPRSDVDVSVSDCRVLDEQTRKVGATVTFKTDSMETGYYAIASGDSTKVQVLFNVAPQENIESEITEIKTKYKKGAQKVIFTINGKNLDRTSDIMLVSTLSEQDGTNRRIPLAVTSAKKDGSRLIMQTDSITLQADTYALVLDSVKTYSIQYMEVASNFTAKVKELTVEQSEELFFKPEPPEEIADEALVLAVVSADSSDASEKSEVAITDNVNGRLIMPQTGSWFTCQSLYKPDLSNPESNASVVEGNLLYFKGSNNGVRFVSTDPAILNIIKSGNALSFTCQVGSEPHYWGIDFILENEKHEQCYMRYRLEGMKYKKRKSSLVIYDIPYSAFTRPNATPKMEYFSVDKIKAISFFCDSKRPDVKFDVGSFFVPYIDVYMQQTVIKKKYK